MSRKSGHKVKSKLVVSRKRKECKLEAGIMTKRKGRPPKNYVISEADKAAELKYIISLKEARIKLLEMEKKRMRDFLSLRKKAGKYMVSYRYKEKYIISRLARYL